MPNLRSVANEYHAHANALAARGDKAGKLTPNQQKAIAYYRDAADKIAALGFEDEGEQGTVWHNLVRQTTVAPVMKEKK